MQKLVLIKFGGSVITDKNREETANLENIRALVNQVKDIISSQPDLSILLGTGAGSYGHIQVEKYQLKEKIVTSGQKLGMVVVDRLVGELNDLVVKSLQDQVLPAISIKPSSIYVSNNNQQQNLFTESLVRFLSQQYIPVVYGDMVYDESVGGSILSADKLFYELTDKLKNDFIIDKVVFCGSTNGVLDNGGNTIKELNKENYDQYQDVFFHNQYVDVTGGMKKKVEMALMIASLGIKSYIINMNSLYDCVINNKFIGTIIK